MSRDLTPRQKHFAEEYAKTGNLFQSAVKAGYSEKTAHAMGKRLLAGVGVMEYIESLTRPAHEQRVADIAEVMQYLTSVMRGEVSDQFGLDASLQERTRAAQELMKRYAAADQRQAGALQRLDSMLLEFRAAISEVPNENTPSGGNVRENDGRSTDPDEKSCLQSLENPNNTDGSPENVRENEGMEVGKE